MFLFKQQQELLANLGRNLTKKSSFRSQSSVDETEVTTLYDDEEKGVKVLDLENLKRQRSRDHVKWKSWGLESEHPEDSDGLWGPLTKAITDYYELKNMCRHGGLNSSHRREAWMSSLGLTAKDVEVASSDFKIVLRQSVMTCPGCASFQLSHVHSFGVDYITDDEESWMDHLFSKHALSTVGQESAKRVMLVLNAKLNIEYCPQIPDLVCLLLLYCNEEEVYAIITRMLRDSKQHKKRWKSHNCKGGVYFALGRVESYVFVKTFLSLFSERLPVLYRCLEDLAIDMDEIESVFMGWFERFFVGVLPLRYVIRVFDCFMVEGPKVLYRVGLTLLKNFRTKILQECCENKDETITLSISQLMEACADELLGLQKEKNALLRNRKLQDMAASVATTSHDDAVTLEEKEFQFQSASKASRVRFLKNVYREGSRASSASSLQDLFRSDEELKQAVDVEIEDDDDLADDENEDFGKDFDFEEFELDKEGAEDTSKYPFPMYRRQGSLKKLSVELDMDEASQALRTKSQARLVRSYVTGQNTLSNELSGRTIAQNELTIRGPNRKSSLESLSSSDEESIIVVQNRYGSKAFYSESSLFKSSSVAGASMMQKIVGPGPVVKHCASVELDHFELKVFLNSAFGWRNLSKKALLKKDETMRKKIGSVPLQGQVIRSRPIHYPHSLLEKSRLLKNVEMSSKLANWLPIKLAPYVPKLRLLYSTDTHGRSLHSLYEACNQPNIQGSIILIQCLNQRGGESTVIGAFNSTTFSYCGQDKYVGDESCFLFRLREDPKECKMWQFAGTIDHRTIGLISSPRSRLRSLSSADSHSPTMKKMHEIALRSAANHENYRDDETQQQYGGKDEEMEEEEKEQPFQPIEAKEHLLQDQIEQETRLSFVRCGFDELVFGTTSVIFVKDDDQRVDPEDIADMDDDEVAELNITRKIGGPGLWVNNDLTSGHTGWCSTYANEPLCLPDECKFSEDDKNQDMKESQKSVLHRYFEIGTIEIFGIPRL